MDLALERADRYGRYRDYVEQEISRYASWETHHARTHIGTRVSRSMSSARLDGDGL